MTAAFRRRVSVLPPLPPGVWLRRPAPTLPFPLAEPSCRLFSRARHGLFHAIDAVGVRAGDELLVPAYHHGSEVEVLARRGVHARFYDVGPDLTPDPEGLDELVGARTRGLYLIHYVGVPQDAERWRRWCDERGLLLVEDAAQAWLASTAAGPVGSWGDVAIFCLYKTYGLPDGAAVTARSPALAGPSGEAGFGGRTLLRRHGRWAAARLGAAAALASWREERREYSATRDFELGDPDSPPARASTLLLARVVTDHAAGARLSNLRWLAARLGDRVPPALRAVPDGASPHALPVRTPDPEGFVAHLAGRGVRAFPFWTHAHPSLPEGEFPGAAGWRRELIVLPVHQELRDDDLERIVDAVEAAPEGC